MKVSNSESGFCRASLSPHAGEIVGPWDLRLGWKYQTPLVQKWDGLKCLLHMEQPYDHNNFTMVRVMFLKGQTRKPSFVAGLTFKRARVYRGPNKELLVRIKSRYIGTLPHPLPPSSYDGNMMHTDRYVVYTFQAVSMQVDQKTQEKRTIIVPGDPSYNESLAEATRTFSRDDELGR